jgi:hypothetical protein
MFLNYEQFLNESVDSRLKIAQEASKDPHLAEILNDCEEGKYPGVQVVITPGTKSYVGVAINDGDSISEVYPVGDPKVALVAIAMKNTGKSDPESISKILTASPDDWLNYTVFAGERELSPEDIANKYNFKYQVPAGDAMGVFTSTPVKKMI